jgi:hypothetical protein
MIKNIFFPQKIGNKFFFTQSFNVFEYDKNIICISGKNEKNNVIITKIYNEIPAVETADLNQLINDLVEKKTDENIILLPDHLVLYRKLKLPITDRSTIKNIINFEVGPTLPFDINSSVFDFFIVPENDRKNCTVWVTFVLKEVLKNFLEPFENINLSIKSSLPIAVDLIEILNLKGEYIVCYQNGNVITILYFLDNLLNDVFLVTADSFVVTLTNIINTTQCKDNIYLLSDIKDSAKFNCHKIEIKSFKNLIINVKNKANVPLLTFGAAMRLNYSDSFNLAVQEQFRKENLYQILVFFGLFLAFLGVMLSNIIFNNYRFRSAEKKLVVQVRNELKKVGLDSKKLKLPLIIKDVEKEIATQEAIWNAFSKQKRFSYLLTLSEFTKIINKDDIGLVVKKILISPNMLTLEGSVRDFPALQKLEEDINKSPYFKTITPLQETSFNVNIKVLQDGVKA